jgi:transcriptional regulator with XRE-family HTH domain
MDEGAPMPPKNDAPTDGLGARMAKARTERGMTQAQLAERLHVRQAMVSMIEANEAEYSDELAKRIRSWVDSGAGPKTPSARGPYTKKRTTIPGK